MNFAKRSVRRAAQRKTASSAVSRFALERLESRHMLAFSFADFSNTAGLKLNGNAAVAGNALLVTDDVANKAGSVYYNQAFPLSADASFSSTMAIQIAAGQGTNGGDGMAFVIQNVAAGASALGGAGGKLGYAGIGAASIAIELDTYKNTFDANNNGVSLLSGGVETTSLVTATSPVDLNSGSVVNMWVNYDGPTNLLQVFVSGTTTKPATPLLSRTIDLPTLLGGQAYFGFSGGTGGLTNEHRVLSWNVDTPESNVVRVFAAGATGTETISLLIDGATVSTFTNVGGNYNTGVFQTFTYNSPTPVTPDKVRVAFTNDGSTPAGADRNVRIDAISINGVRYESEAPYVFSIGSGATGDPGFAQSEILFVNGYFQYAAGFPANPGAVGLDTSVVSVDETAGVVNVSIKRTGGSDGIVTVDYHTYSDTAVGGQDFTSVSSRAVFFPGQTLVTIAVPILNDDDEEPTETFDFTIDNVLGGASLLVPRTAIVSILDDETPPPGAGFGFNFANFDSTTGLKLNGNAAAVGGTLLLTDDLPTLAGSAYYTEPMPLDEDISFSAALAVQMTGGQGTGGADGMAFVIQNVGAGASALGGAGGGLGYVGIGAASIAIELDTFQNTFDLNDNNVSILINGDEVTPVVTALAPVDLNSGSVVHVWVDYDGATNLLKVYIAGAATKPATPLLSQTINLTGLLGDQAYFGVSAGTGGLVNEHRLVSWSVDSSAAPPVPTYEIKYDNFNSTTGLQLNGNAAAAGGVLLLTDDVAAQAGSAFYNQALPLDGNASFSAAMAIQMSGGQGTNGADGMAFVIQNTTAGILALGGSGGALGYAGMGAASIAIEFDTYQNTFDANANNVSVLVNGDEITPLITAPAPVDLNSGAAVYVWVDYDGPTNLLKVYVSGTATKPATPLLTQTIDLVATLGNQAYFGFSGGTGGLSNEHRVLSWSVSSSAVAPQPQPSVTAQTVVAGLALPTAIEWSNDGQVMYIAQKGGIIRVYRNGQLQTAPLLDISSKVNSAGDRGLLDIAVHPNLAANPYVYAIYAYDPPETANYTGLAGRDGAGNRAARMSRFTLDAATGYTSLVPNSEVIMLGTNSTWANFNGFVDSTINFTEPPAGILPNGDNLRDFLAADSQSHTIGTVDFGPDGALYVSNGDGTSYNQVDARAVRVQDVNNLSGKILRIDPLTGAGLPDNPFYNGDAQSNRSKVYQYGFRNPFRFSIDTAGKVFVGDVGWVTWEEIDIGAPGSNFGWPYFEGGNAGSLRTDEYENLPQAQAFYASGQPVVAPLLALNHRTDLINAIVVGDRYEGNVYSSQFQGDLFFNDLGRGIVRNVSFNPDGSIASVNVFATGAEVVVQIITGPDGYLYFVDLDNGIVGRWIENPLPAAAASAPAAANVPVALTSTAGETTAASESAVAAASMTVESQSPAASASAPAFESVTPSTAALRAVAVAESAGSNPSSALRRAAENPAKASKIKRAAAGLDGWFYLLGRDDT